MSAEPEVLICRLALTLTTMSDAYICSNMTTKPSNSQLQLWGPAKIVKSRTSSNLTASQRAHIRSTLPEPDHKQKYTWGENKVQSYNIYNFSQLIYSKLKYFSFNSVFNNY